MNSVRMMSWNVNGIRAAYRNGFMETVRDTDSDIVLLQEVKADRFSIPEEIYHSGYHTELYPAGKKGYSGTMALFRRKPLSVVRGIGNETADSEGRVLALEYDGFYVINSYFPNSQRELTRLDFKLEFDHAFMDFCGDLRKNKPVVICGDFNVAHQDIDIARPDDNRKNAGFTEQERNWMTEFLGNGFTDTYRMFTNEGGHYSWWSYRFDARKRNIGWRIDYFIVSDGLKNNVRGASILEEAEGSDHAPVTLELEF